MNSTILPQMDALRALEHTLHTEIPLTRAMGVSVRRFDADGLVLGAPLALNINHKKTAFGGSLATLATLAGWGLLQLLLREHGPVTVVIQENQTHYLKPVVQDFEAICPLPPEAVREKFFAALTRKGMARIELDVTIPAAAGPAVLFHGRFVTLDKTRHPHAEPI
jgi:thioesterase domain-containing protein